MVIVVACVAVAVCAWQIASHVGRPARIAMSVPLAATAPAPEPATPQVTQAGPQRIEDVAPVVVEDSAAQADQEDTAISASEESTMAEMVGWQQVAPGAWFIPEVASAGPNSGPESAAGEASAEAQRDDRQMMADLGMDPPEVWMARAISPENRTPGGDYRAAYGMSAEHLAAAGLSTPESVRELQRKRQFRRDLAEALKRRR